jgi:hypothetical protein
MIRIKREVHNRTNYDAIQRALARWEKQEQESKNVSDPNKDR